MSLNMSTFTRQPLSQLSSNTLNRQPNEQKKIKLPKVEELLSLKTANFPSFKPQFPPTVNHTTVDNASVKKPLITKHNTEMLKVRLQLAHYRLRTKQEKTPFKDIFKNHPYSLELKLEEFNAKKKPTSATAKPEKFKKRTLTAPSGAPLLAASTPLKSKPIQHHQLSSDKKRVAFIKSKSFNGPIHSEPVTLEKVSKSKPSEIKPKPTLRGSMSSISNRSTVDSTVVTPVKESRKDGGAELLTSSPTKKATPGRYAAASLLLGFQCSHE